MVSEALDGLTYDPATIAKDRRQGVFAQSFLQFAGRMVSGNRLERRLLAAEEERVDLRQDSAEYGVPGPVLVGFWGLETDFGKVMGNMETLRSLATLAFDCRRPDEFSEQLLDAMRVIERGDSLQARCEALGRARWASSSSCRASITNMPWISTVTAGAT